MSLSEYETHIDGRQDGYNPFSFKEDKINANAMNDCAKTINVLGFLLELYSYYVPPKKNDASNSSPVPTVSKKRKRANSGTASHCSSFVYNADSSDVNESSNDALDTAMQEKECEDGRASDTASLLSVSTRRSSIATRTTATRVSRLASVISASSHDVCKGASFSFDCSNWGEGDEQFDFPAVEHTQPSGEGEILDESAIPAQPFDIERVIKNEEEIRRLSAINSYPSEETPVTKLDLATQKPLIPFNDTNRFIPYPRAFAFCTDANLQPRWEDESVFLPRLPVHTLPDDPVNDILECACGPFTSMDPQLLSAIFYYHVTVPKMGSDSRITPEDLAGIREN